MHKILTFRKSILFWVFMSILSIAPSKTDNTKDSLTAFEEGDVLEATLLYLLAGLEVWGAWLEPTNDVGLLPEAEGRFMVSSTPILQTGTIPGGIGVVGFAQPITISHNGVPSGFSESEFYKSSLVNYDDYIEDVFEQESYLDRLNYQYGIEITGRRGHIYRKPIEIELTLASMLQKMGAPPDVVEIWVEEYSKIANLPQTIQLSWLIAGNPLAKDYKLHIENVLEAFDLNTLLAQGTVGQDFPSSPASNTQWVNQDPFWEEVQKQPLINAFTNLLSDTSEEIQRSFIISLFFLEPVPLGVGAVGKVNDGQTNNNMGAKLRLKPLFWLDSAATTSSGNSIPPITDPIRDADRGLVTEALRRETNLIRYWSHEQGYKIIPWSEINLLDPNDKDTPYFIMAVTALPQLGPSKQLNHKSNYETIVKSIVNNHLPQNQPVFKVFVGSETNDRKIVDAKGLLIGLAGNSFLWSAKELDNDAFLHHAVKHHETRNTPYVVARIDNGPYISGSLSQIREFFVGRSDYIVETVIVKLQDTHTGNTNTALVSSNTGISWLNNANNVAQDIFNWSLPKQDGFLIQSTSRAVQFEVGHNSSLEIKASSMVTWKTLPSNEELLEQREQQRVHSFLVQVQQGYFLIPVDELEYLQQHVDVEQSSVENLQVSTLVPVYRLEGLGTAEREGAISVSITDVLQRILQFFPKQREFEILMSDGQRVKYSTTPPHNFRTRHDYDTINVRVFIEGQTITFYASGGR